MIRHRVAGAVHEPIHRRVEGATVAVDGSKVKVVDNRGKNFTERKRKARLQQLDESVDGQNLPSVRTPGMSDHHRFAVRTNGATMPTSGHSGRAAVAILPER